MSQRYSTHAPGLPEAPFWLSVLLPAAVYPLLILTIFVAPSFYYFMMAKEGGIEYVAVAVLLVGVAYGVALLARRRRVLPAGWLVGWFALATLAAFVLAGEELSWGQHLGLWEHEDVPEALQTLNDQGETNLHNIGNTFDQGPTNLVVLATFVGFVVIPLHLRRKRETMGVDNPGYWFWPTRAGLIAAIGVLVIPFPKRIYEWTTGEEGFLELRHSEVHEFYIALLFTIYLASAYRRADGLARGMTATGAAEAAPAASAEADQAIKAGTRSA